MDTRTLTTEYGTVTRYKRETEVVSFQGREIVLETLTPILTPEQEQRARRELEQQLYDVFRKYADTRRENDRKTTG